MSGYISGLIASFPPVFPNEIPASEDSPERLLGKLIPFSEVVSGITLVEDS